MWKYVIISDKLSMTLPPVKGGSTERQRRHKLVSSRPRQIVYTHHRHPQSLCVSLWTSKIDLLVAGTGAGKGSGAQVEPHDGVLVPNPITLQLFSPPRRRRGLAADGFCVPDGYPTAVQHPVFVASRRVRRGM
ncbi:hypothetical protein FRC19_006352 [Serendipita sp. 401]|nr:hypothetical protein FRC19_006352 [Serendipita sp. 401]KAG9053113.1 hypothetical protein FS842_008667 [Serendipita sp. 407]